MVATSLKAITAMLGQPQHGHDPALRQDRQPHHRLLGNGYCTRPPELDCAFESIWETCTFFQTSIEFRPTLQAQHDGAATVVPMLVSSGRSLPSDRFGVSVLDEASNLGSSTGAD